MSSLVRLIFLVLVSALFLIPGIASALGDMADKQCREPTVREAYNKDKPPFPATYKEKRGTQTITITNLYKMPCEDVTNGKVAVKGLCEAKFVCGGKQCLTTGGGYEACRQPDAQVNTSQNTPPSDSPLLDDDGNVMPPVNNQCTGLGCGTPPMTTTPPPSLSDTGEVTGGMPQPANSSVDFEKQILNVANEPGIFQKAGDAISNWWDGGSPGGGIGTTPLNASVFDGAPTTAFSDFESLQPQTYGPNGEPLSATLNPSAESTFANAQPQNPTNDDISWWGRIREAASDVAGAVRDTVVDTATAVRDTVADFFTPSPLATDTPAPSIGDIEMPRPPTGGEVGVAPDPQTAFDAELGRVNLPPVPSALPSLTPGGPNMGLDPNGGLGIVAEGTVPQFRPVEYLNEIGELGVSRDLLGERLTELRESVREGKEYIAAENARLSADYQALKTACASGNCTQAEKDAYRTQVRALENFVKQTNANVDSANAIAQVVNRPLDLTSFSQPLPQSPENAFVRNVSAAALNTIASQEAATFWNGTPGTEGLAAERARIASNAFEAALQPATPALVADAFGDSNRLNEIRAQSQISAAQEQLQQIQQLRDVPINQLTPAQAEMFYNEPIIREEIARLERETLARSEMTRNIQTTLRNSEYGSELARALTTQPTTPAEVMQQRALLAAVTSYSNGLNGANLLAASPQVPVGLTPEDYFVQADPNSNSYTDRIAAANRDIGELSGAIPPSAETQRFLDRINGKDTFSNVFSRGLADVTNVVASVPALYLEILGVNSTAAHVINGFVNPATWGAAAFDAVVTQGGNPSTDRMLSQFSMSPGERSFSTAMDYVSFAGAMMPARAVARLGAADNLGSFTATSRSFDIGDSIATNAARMELQPRDFGGRAASNDNTAVLARTGDNVVPFSSRPGSDIPTSPGGSPIGPGGGMRPGNSSVDAVGQISQDLAPSGSGPTGRLVTAGNDNPITGGGQVQGNLALKLDLEPPSSATLPQRSNLDNFISWKPEPPPVAANDNVLARPTVANDNTPISRPLVANDNIPSLGAATPLPGTWAPPVSGGLANLNTTSIAPDIATSNNQSFDAVSQVATDYRELGTELGISRQNMDLALAQNLANQYGDLGLDVSPSALPEPSPASAPATAPEPTAPPSSPFAPPTSPIRYVDPVEQIRRMFGDGAAAAARQALMDGRSPYEWGSFLGGGAGGPGDSGSAGSFAYPHTPLPPPEARVFQFPTVNPTSRSNFATNLPTGQNVIKFPIDDKPLLTGPQKLPTVGGQLMPGFGDATFGENSSVWTLPLDQITPQNLAAVSEGNPVPGRAYSDAKGDYWTIAAVSENTAVLRPTVPEDLERGQQPSKATTLPEIARVAVADQVPAQIWQIHSSDLPKVNGAEVPEGSIFNDSNGSMWTLMNTSDGVATLRPTLYGDLVQASTGPPADSGSAPASAPEEVLPSRVTEPSELATAPVLPNVAFAQEGSLSPPSIANLPTAAWNPLATVSNLSRAAVLGVGLLGTPLSPFITDAFGSVPQNLSATQKSDPMGTFAPTNLVAKVAPITGAASTYNPNLPGYRTGGQLLATGGRYNPIAYEAAIQLDLGRKIGMGIPGKIGYALVEYGDKKLVVKVNDNGPLVPGRIIDLNEASMRYLSNGRLGKNSGVLPKVTVTPLQGQDYVAGPVAFSTVAAAPGTPPQAVAPTAAPPTIAPAPLPVTFRGDAVPLPQLLALMHPDVIPAQTTVSPSANNSFSVKTPDGKSLTFAQVVPPTTKKDTLVTNGIYNLKALRDLNQPQLQNFIEATKGLPADRFIRGDMLGVILPVLAEYKARYGVVPVINGIGRTVSVNTFVGGAWNSDHLTGLAVDWKTIGVAPSRIQDLNTMLANRDLVLVTIPHGQGPHTHSGLQREATPQEVTNLSLVGTRPAQYALIDPSGKELGTRLPLSPQYLARAREEGVVQVAVQPAPVERPGVTDTLTTPDPSAFDYDFTLAHAFGPLYSAEKAVPESIPQVAVAPTAAPPTIAPAPLPVTLPIAEIRTPIPQELATVKSPIGTFEPPIRVNPGPLFTADMAWPEPVFVTAMPLPLPRSSALPETAVASEAPLTAAEIAALPLDPKTVAQLGAEATAAVPEPKNISAPPVLVAEVTPPLQVVANVPIPQTRPNIPAESSVDTSLTPTPLPAPVFTAATVPTEWLERPLIAGAPAPVLVSDVPLPRPAPARPAAPVEVAANEAVPAPIASVPLPRPAPLQPAAPVEVAVAQPTPEVVSIPLPRPAPVRPPTPVEVAAVQPVPAPVASVPLPRPAPARPPTPVEVTVVQPTPVFVSIPLPRPAPSRPVPEIQVAEVTPAAPVFIAIPLPRPAPTRSVVVADVAPSAPTQAPTAPATVPNPERVPLIKQINKLDADVQGIQKMVSAIETAASGVRKSNSAMQASPKNARGMLAKADLTVAQSVGAAQSTLSQARQLVAQSNKIAQDPQVSAATRKSITDLSNALSASISKAQTDLAKSVGFESWTVPQSYRPGIQTGTDAMAALSNQLATAALGAANARSADLSNQIAALNAQKIDLNTKLAAIPETTTTAAVQPIAPAPIVSTAATPAPAPVLADVPLPQPRPATAGSPFGNSPSVPSSPSTVLQARLAIREPRTDTTGIGSTVRAEKALGPNPPQDVWSEALTNPEPSVLIVAGGQGAGKTTLVERLMPDLEKQIAAVLDGTTDAANTALKIDEAIAAGKTVTVAHIHRDFGASGAEQSWQIVRDLLDDPRVVEGKIKILLFDNSGAAGEATLMNQEAFRNLPQRALDLLPHISEVGAGALEKPVTELNIANSLFESAVPIASTPSPAVATPQIPPSLADVSFGGFDLSGLHSYLNAPKLPSRSNTVVVESEPYSLAGIPNEIGGFDMSGLQRYVNAQNGGGGEGIPPIPPPSGSSGTLEPIPGGSLTIAKEGMSPLRKAWLALFGILIGTTANTQPAGEDSALIPSTQNPAGNASTQTPGQAPGGTPKPGPTNVDPPVTQPTPIPTSGKPVPGTVHNAETFCITSINPVIVLTIPAGTPFPSNCFNGSNAPPVPSSQIPPSQIPPKQTPSTGPSTQQPSTQQPSTQQPSTQPGGDTTASGQSSIGSRLSNALGNFLGAFMKALGIGSSPEPKPTGRPAVTPPSTPPPIMPIPTPKPIPPRPTSTVSIVANPSLVDVGEAARLSWSSTGANSCSVFSPSGDIVGSGNPSGSTSTPALATTTVFKITCTGGIHTVTGETTVTVK